MARAGLTPPKPENRTALDNFRRAGERGSVVHKMCELYDTGREHEFEMDPTLEGYAIAWRNFCEEYGFQSELTEVPLPHEIYQFGGTPDTAGNSSLLGGFTVAERKTRELQDYDGFQLAAQELLVQRELKTDKPMFLLGVRLKQDGHFEVRVYSAKRTFYRGLFLAAVSVANYQISQGR